MGSKHTSSFRLLYVPLLLSAPFLMGQQQCQPSPSTAVPDVVGLTLSAAEPQIVGAGLTATVEEEQWSDTVPQGNVISQDPPAGTMVDNGAEVHLVLSLGPLPSEGEREEAMYLALELTGELLAPEFLVDQIQADLSAIRAAYPDMRGIRHRPLWVIGEILVALTPEAFEAYERGEFTAFDELNEFFGLVSAQVFNRSRGSMGLGFELPYHPERVAEEYEPIEGIRYAEPNGWCCDGSTIIADLPFYTFSKRWGDCPAGCMLRHNWLFSVEHGVVTLIEESGPPLDTGSGT